MAALISSSNLIFLVWAVYIASNALNVNALPYLPILLGYMNLQNEDHNACQIDGSGVQNQLALGADMFSHNLCGHQVSVVVGDVTLSGTVIDALDASKRIMVSPNLFEQVASLDTGIVQGMLVSNLMNDQMSTGKMSTSSSIPAKIPNMPFQIPVIRTSLDLPHETDYSTHPSSNPETSHLTPLPLGTSTIDPLAGQQIDQKGIVEGAQQHPHDIQQGYQHVLYSSNPQDSNDATFYFSADGGPGKCGAINGIASFPESHGITACEPSVGSKTLMERNNNNIVAIPINMLNKELYCGKKVEVTIGGKTRDDLVVWDLCAACGEPGNGGLDFSSDMFAALFGEERCSEGRIQNQLSWRILDEQVIEWAP